MLEYVGEGFEQGLARNNIIGPRRCTVNANFGVQKHKIQMSTMP